MTQPLYRRRWRVVSATQPAAGGNWSLTPGGGNVWRIVSLTAQLVTDVNVANRRAILSASDGERVWYSARATADQAASQTTRYTAHTGSDSGGASPGTLRMSLPAAGLLLHSGHRLEVATDNIQVGDQWSAITALVDEIITSGKIVGDATGVGPWDTQEAP